MEAVMSITNKVRNALFNMKVTLGSNKNKF